MKALTVRKMASTTVLALLALSGQAYAEDRVIEDSLVYNDPTVAEGSAWIKGVTLDLFSFSQDISDPTMTGSLTYQQPGISGFVGYGDFTVIASYRYGTGTANVTSPINGVNVSINDSFTQSEYEVDVRWLITKFQMSHFTPYALAGYSGASLDQTASAPAYNVTVKASNKTGAPLVGIGGIIPINEKFGVRVDDRIGFVNDTYSDSTTTTTSSYQLNRLTVTGYYNFAQSWNAQAGFRVETDSNSSGSTVGEYVMIGYTFK